MPDVSLYGHLVKVFIVFKQLLCVIVNLICQLDFCPACTQSTNAILGIDAEQNGSRVYVALHGKPS